MAVYRLVDGLTLTSSPIPNANHTSPPPTAAEPSVDESATSIGSPTESTLGSKRAYEPMSPYASQTAPAPVATPVGVNGSPKVRLSVRVVGSIFDSDSSSRLPTHTNPSPT